LVIRYTNGTGQELNNAYLQLSYPAHFNLLELTSDETPLASSTVSLGTLAPNATGSIKIRGIMYGDVGGQQIFDSKLTFTYGKNNKSGEKTSSHTFSPVHSVLQLSLELPEKIIASQPFTGYVVYTNSGENDLPLFKITPIWPENFSLISSQPKIDSVNNSWKIDGTKANETGKIEFIGQTTENDETINLTFNPFFSFGDTEYKQDPLVQTISITQPQVKLSHGVDSSSVKPGGIFKTTIKYENTGETPIYNLELTALSDSPFISSISKQTINELAAGTSGETEIDVKLKSSIAQSETLVYENLKINIKASASYRMENNETAQKITVTDSTVSVPLTTPISLKSVGRYSSDYGDQLGRGPLPPMVGEETKYWIFWSVSGTTNKIDNLTISGQLPNNVTFTGLQTVSEGNAVTYDSTNRTVTWKTTTLPATFSPSAKIIGVAFEVAITPSEDQTNTSPPLISGISASGTDAFTGTWVMASGTTVTTNLPNDLMAKGLGTVIQ